MKRNTQHTDEAKLRMSEAHVRLREAREQSVSDLDEPMEWSNQNAEIWRIAQLGLDTIHTDILRAALLGALMPMVEPDDFVKAVRVAVRYLHAGPQSVS